MPTLFNVKINWGIYLLTLLAIYMLFPFLSFFSLAALAITLHQFMLLFYSLGAAVPIRYLSGSFMCLQFLLGPTFAFNGLDAYQTNQIYTMKIPEAEYFAYAIPAMIMFILGLHVTAGRLKGEILDEKGVTKFIDNSGNLPYVFVGLGFISGYLAPVFGSELAFVFYLLGGFKFIGAFMLILGSHKTKTWVLVLVFGSIIVSTLKAAMFHDLLTWMIMLGGIISIKYKPPILVKAAATSGFILLAVIIQQVKGEYRKSAWSGEGGLEVFQNTVNETEESGSLFSFESLARSNIRINQGYIVTSIMKTVPESEPYSNGVELMQILEAAFLPRILAPNKLNAGDRTIFTRYSHIPLQPGTSMALSSLGDGYINFGVIGGCIFMFMLGLSFSVVLNGFQRFSRYYPFLLLFTPLVFYYPIRPDCELQTSFGHLVKSCFLIYIMLVFWKKKFTKASQEKSTARPALA